MPGASVAVADLGLGPDRHGSETNTVSRTFSSSASSAFLPLWHGSGQCQGQVACGDALARTLDTTPQARALTGAAEGATLKKVKGSEP